MQFGVRVHYGSAEARTLRTVVEIHLVSNQRLHTAPKLEMAKLLWLGCGLPDFAETWFRGSYGIVESVILYCGALQIL